MGLWGALETTELYYSKDAIQADNTVSEGLTEATWREWGTRQGHSDPHQLLRVTAQTLPNSTGVCMQGGGHWQPSFFFHHRRKYILISQSRRLHR